MWLTSAVSGYICLAVVTILDKYILSERKVRPILYVFYSTIFVVPIWFLLPFGVKIFASPAQWLSALAAGLGFALTLWALYRAVAESEASHIGPFIGAVVPSFVLVFGRIFLNEQITSLSTSKIFDFVAAANPKQTLPLRFPLNQMPSLDKIHLS